MSGIVVNGVLLTGHKGPAVEVPFDPAPRWGTRQVPLRPGRRGFPVAVVLSGAPFESVIVSRMRRFFVLVPWSVARQVGLAVGDRVRLVVRLAQPSPTLPPPSAAQSKPKATAGRAALGKTAAPSKPPRRSTKR
jgi:Domain of unknown function (DUF1905)